MQFFKSLSFVRQLVLKSNKIRLLSISGNHLNKDKDHYNEENNDVSDGVVIYDPVSNEPQIPSALHHKEETIHVKRARLLYQSRKRGIHLDISQSLLHLLIECLKLQLFVKQLNYICI